MPNDCRHHIIGLAFAASLSQQCAAMMSEGPIPSPAAAPAASRPRARVPSETAAVPRREPWVQLKTYRTHPCIYPAMIRETSPGVRPGDRVYIYDREGQPFGVGLYNPKARVPLRVFHFGAEEFGETDFLRLLDRAVDLRLGALRVAEHGDAYRVVHSDGDGLSGLVVDRFGDVLSAEVHSLGVFQRLPQWLPHLHARLGTRRQVIDVDPQIARLEGISPRKVPSDPVRQVRILEHGVRYEVDFEEGHKTGFFCDQRENRRQLAEWTRDRRVLDLCCYTGGFALAAKVLGAAADVIGVDLDETAIARARRNANLNQVRGDWVHCDAFSYARQMQRNGTRWEVVVLDPPKLVMSRDTEEEGLRKYEDLNGLAMTLVAPAGLLVTCSCSGLVSAEAFEQRVIRAAFRAGRQLQILDRTGPGGDHPEMSNCPESRYLKVLWTRVL